MLCGDLAFLMRSALAVLIISAFHGAQGAAGFQAVFPAARLNELILTTFTALFMSGAARLYASGDQLALSQLCHRTTIWTTLLSFPMFLVSILFSEEICVLLFGSVYAQSSTTMAVLSLGFFLSAGLGMHLRLIRVVADARQMLAVDAVSMVAAIVLNFAFIPWYGESGGAWAICWGFLIQGIANIVFVWRFVGVAPLSPAVVRTYLVCAATAAVAWGFSFGLDLGLEARLVAGSLGFATLVVCCRREFDMPSVFPEISRAPWIGRLFRV